MKRSKHSLSNYKLLTGDMGELLPVGLTEVLPGDTIQQATSALIRCSPLLAPVMHPVRVSIHHWFVPHRLVWNDWENFITGGPDGLNASTFPTITTGAGGQAIGSLPDYFGIPTGVNNLFYSALPIRGYALIWNEFYRDQDLQTALTIDLTDGVDSTTSQALQNVSWEKDYFTSSRPWTQKGAEVTLPLSGIAPVTGIGRESGNETYDDGPKGVKETGGGTPTYTYAALANEAAWVIKGTAATGGAPSIYADLSNATGSTINEFREAMALQRYEEARARYGSRYSEYLKYLGVMAEDQRLQRPEYLGGGRQTIQFSEILQTGVTTSGASAGVGNLTGHGISAMRSNRYRRYFQEHGYIISLLSVKPKTMYAQGLPRTWNRRTKEDFWQKEIEHVGQQEVLNKELYAAHASPDGIFGFQDRYDEYRRTESTIAGEFRTTLNFWHYARIFGSDPALNADFVKSVPTKRVNQVTTNDVLWIMVNHSIQARRLVTKEGTSFMQ